MERQQNRHFARRGWPAAALCALLAVGCAGEPAADQAASEESAPSLEATGPLGDPEILAVVRTVNSGEVAAAELATERAAAGETREFAQHVMADHSAANEQVATLAATIPPKDNPLSMKLRESAFEEIEKLEQQQGEEFDRAFIEAQARRHEQVLETIDERLLPAASDQQLRMLLETTREKVAGHLEHAQMLRGESAPSTSTGG